MFQRTLWSRVFAAGSYAHEPATDGTPEKLFNRRWALDVIAAALRRLEAEYRRAGMAQMFVVLQPFLVGENHSDFAELSGRLNRSEGAARVMVFRLRNRFRQLLRNVIADTVADPEQVENEIEALVRHQRRRRVRRRGSAGRWLLFRTAQRGRLWLHD